MHRALPDEVSSKRIDGVSIDLRAVLRRFDNGLVALEGLTLSVSAGEFVAILGPSGCGKSTLLRLVARLDQPQSGTVNLPRLGRDDVAFVFQDAHLLPWRNVLANVALPLELLHASRRERHRAARAAIEQVGLTDAIDRYPNQLSGGMRMRVSLARAMVSRPRLLLMDEPFAALDEITRQRLDEQLRTLWMQAGMTVLFVTHSTTEAAFLAQRAIVLSRRPGRVIADHPIALPMDRNGELRATATFASHIRVLYEALERSEA